jgi:SAM-dependent methyltransferase
MDFAGFDARGYPVVSVQEGYGAWAKTYEQEVLENLDRPLLERIQRVVWERVREAADLACGTGRTGAWLAQRGVAALDGADLTPEMLSAARARGIYRRLETADMLSTPLPAGSYDLVTESLADEHIAELEPLYAEAARLARAGGYFVLVGYHPFFLLSGVPTHFDRAPGEPVTIRCYVHLLSEHITAGIAAGWRLEEMHEGLVDEAMVAKKPKWRAFANRPVSFVLVWRKDA